MIGSEKLYKGLNPRKPRGGFGVNQLKKMAQNNKRVLFSIVAIVVLLLTIQGALAI